MEAMIINAQGFATLAITAESKNLMSLFCLTRKVKKQSLLFGLKPGIKPKPFDRNSTRIIVAVSRKGLGFSAAFIQGY